MQHSTWHELIKKELPEHYFGKINQFYGLCLSAGVDLPTT